MTGYIQSLGALSAQTAAPNRDDDMQTRPAENHAAQPVGTAVMTNKRSVRRIGVPVTATALVLAGCRGWQSATDPQGPQALQLDALIWSSSSSLA